VAAALAAASVAARSTAGFATGAAECCVCPVCRAITTMRDPSPEFAERLATGFGDLATGFAAVLRAFGTPPGGPGEAPPSGPPEAPPEAPPGAPPEPSAGAADGRHVDFGRGQDDAEPDPWQAATRTSTTPQTPPSPAPDPVPTPLAKAVRQTTRSAGAEDGAAVGA